jgi:catechol 2,3-dioxygenase-like lactoylglutathione lyase family enzyme
MASLIHVDLLVRDMAASLAFYEHFGCTIAEDVVVRGPVVDFYSRGTADSMRLVLLDLPGARAFSARIELMECRSADGSPLPAPPGERQAAPSIRNFSISVPDVDDALRRLAEIGVAPVSAVLPIDMPRLGKSRIVFVRDPDENLLELVDSKR